MSRLTTKQRRAGRRRAASVRRLYREHARREGYFADVCDYIIAVRDANVSGRIDARLQPIPAAERMVAEWMLQGRT
jgi:hypothetical protein